MSIVDDTGRSRRARLRNVPIGGPAGVRLSVSVPEDVTRQWKVQAAVEETTARELLERSLVDVLRRPDSALRRAVDATDSRPRNVESVAKVDPTIARELRVAARSLGVTNGRLCHAALNEYFRRV